MSEYAVIIDHLPTSTERATEYLDTLRRGFPDAAEIITAANHADSWIAEDDQDFLSWAEQSGVRAVDHALTPWQALNQAVALTTTDFAIILEEDWWPAPLAGSQAIDVLDRHESGVVYLDRRDTTIAELSRIPDGDILRSSPRPASNPGFAYAIRRRDFLAVRGYDERATYERAAGIDLATRFRRAGFLPVSLASPEGTVYHAPEPGPSKDLDGVKPASNLRELAEFVDKDRSVYRNLLDWSVPSTSRPPLVSVAIATKDRGAMIADSLHSVLFQTFQDFEIIVVDDGSEDDLAEQTIREIDDPRITFVRQDPAGISAARNRAADMTSCPLTAVHDDDDIMLPNRLESGIAALTSSNDASYGSWINFSDSTGEMRGFLGKIGFGAEINAFNGQGPGHSTWTLPTWLIRLVRYDTRLTASVDHNLASRLDWLGVRWTHTEKFMYLRRVHEKQVTASDGTGQKIGHILTRYGNNLLCSRRQRIDMSTAGKDAKYPAGVPQAELHDHFAGFLPDKLVRRDVRIVRDVTNGLFAADMPHKMAYVLEDRNLLNRRAHFEGATLEGITLADLAKVRQAGLTGLQVTGTVITEDGAADIEGESETVGDIEQQAEDAVDRAVADAASARVDLVIEEHLRKFPTGSVLVEHDADPYHELGDETLLENAKSARRVVAAGEFGARTTVRIYGYSHQLDGLSLLSKKSAGDGDRFELHTRDRLEGLLRALSPEPTHTDPIEVA